MNKEIAERIYESGASVEKLFSIPLSRESRDFADFIDELSDKEFNFLFPNIEGRPEKGWIFDDLMHDGYFGFVAEVNIPISHSFRFEKGVPKSWTSSLGLCRIFNTYASTIEELVCNIEKAAKIQFDEEVTKELSPIQSTTP